MRSEHSTDMICLEAQYFNVNKILLQSTGLWPFQQSKLNHLQYIIIWIILVTATVCQITAFLTSELTFKFILKVSSCILFFIKLIGYYSSYRFNIEILKDLMGQLHYACTKLKDKNEIAIIQQYGWKARRYTVAMLVMFCIGTFILLISQLIVAFDVVSPINGSRPLLLTVEYFIDQQKYYYLILLHIATATFFGLLSLIASGTLLAMYFEHVCGMFRVAGYRIQHAMEINILKNVSLKSKSLIYKKIVYAVYIHREAMRLSKLLISTFDILYLCMAALLVITLSLSLFQIFQIITSADNIADLVYPITIATVMIVHLYFANLFGQHIIDHNNEVYTTAYNIRWYMCPLYVQKLILLLLQRRAKEFHLTVGGLFTGSFDCLAMQMKATISYFTVMYSTR